MRRRHWHRWLWLLTAAHVPGGLLLALLSTGSGEWLKPLLPLALEPGTARIFMGFFGPTVAAWAVLGLALLHEARLRPVLYRSYAVSVLVWLLPDALLCLHHGFTQWLLIDLAVAPLLLGPALWLSRRPV